RPLARRHYRGTEVPLGGPLVDARTPLLFNEDVIISLARPTAADPVWVVDGDADELLFVQEGAGTVLTPLGSLRYERLDYVVLPKGLPHRVVPDEGVDHLILSVHG